MTLNDLERQYRGFYVVFGNFGLRHGYIIHKVAPRYWRWWRGIVGNAFWLKQSYSTPGPVSTAMGDCLWAGKPSQCKACQLGRLSLLPSVVSGTVKLFHKFEGECISVRDVFLFVTSCVIEDCQTVSNLLC